jgi:hypothetical protein
MTKQQFLELLKQIQDKLIDEVDELDDYAKQVVFEKLDIAIDVVENTTDEQTMKEMVYTNENSDNTEILYKGIYKEHKFCIVSHGGYPCAYVECKLDVEDCSDDKLFDVDVHGGFSYDGDAYWDSTDNLMYLGWDYAHSCDYKVWADGTSCGVIHWTTELIYSDVKYVIDQLIKLENKNG